MSDETYGDALLDRVRDARPHLRAELASPHTPAAQALLEEILSVHEAIPHATTPITHRPPRRVAFVAAASVAILAAGVGVLATTHDGDDHTAAVNTRPSHRATGTAPAARPVVTLTRLRAISARTSVVMRGSGRAVVTFAGGTEPGTTDVSFSGDDLDTVMHFPTLMFTGGESGMFTANNKTVDGEFYLLDGPPGAQRWYHDTNSSGRRGSDLFSTDPRTLLALLAPQAAFRDVGTEVVDGVTTTHLEATDLGALPLLNLSLGPIDGSSITALDLWVADNVVRKITVASAVHEQVPDPKTAPQLEKDRNGVLSLHWSDGRVTRIPQGSPIDYKALGVPTVDRTTRSSYSARFFDLGQPVQITAPSDAIDIAAKG